MSFDYRRHGDDWLTDIFNNSEGGRLSVCAICKQKEAINQDSIFSVCKKCERPERIDERAQFEREAQDDREYTDYLHTGGPFDERSKNALEGI